MYYFDKQPQGRSPYYGNVLPGITVILSEQCSSDAVGSE